MVRSSLALIALVASAQLVGCQSKGDALRLICDVESQCECPGDPVALANFVEENVTNEQVKELLVRFNTMSPSARESALRRALESEGIERCAFLDTTAAD